MSIKRFFDRSERKKDSSVNTSTSKNKKKRLKKEKLKEKQIAQLHIALNATFVVVVPKLNTRRCFHNNRYQ